MYIAVANESDMKLRLAGDGIEFWEKFRLRDQMEKSRQRFSRSRRNCHAEIDWSRKSIDIAPTGRSCVTDGSMPTRDSATVIY